VKDDFYAELECVFDKFPKYHIKNLFADAVKEDIFRLTIENEVYMKLVMIMLLEK
jgi:hypothetical protein